MILEHFRGRLKYLTARKSLPYPCPKRHMGLRNHVHQSRPCFSFPLRYLKEKTPFLSGATQKLTFHNISIPQHSNQSPSSSVTNLSRNLVAAVAINHHKHTGHHFYHQGRYQLEIPPPLDHGLASTTAVHPSHCIRYPLNLHAMLISFCGERSRPMLPLPTFPECCAERSLPSFRTVTTIPGFGAPLQCHV